VPPIVNSTNTDQVEPIKGEKLAFLTVGQSANFDLNPFINCSMSAIPSIGKKTPRPHDGLRSCVSFGSSYRISFSRPNAAFREAQ
jgi:hypothetical protein